MIVWLYDAIFIWSVFDFDAWRWRSIPRDLTSSLTHIDDWLDALVAV